MAPCRHMQIKKAILAAVARVRGPDGTTPYVVWDTLRLVLASNDNTGNQYAITYPLCMRSISSMNP